MKVTRWRKLSLHMITAIAVMTVMAIAFATNAAAQFGGPRHASFSPVPIDFTGSWRWAAPRQSCGSVVDSFGKKPIFGDGKKEGTLKTAIPPGNPNLCQWPIEELEKVMNGRGRLWLKTFSPDDAVSPKWTCAISLGEGLTDGVKTFIQRADAVVMWWEASQRGRFIYTDGRQHPPATDMFYWGHSIGWMDGETFVVETTNFTWDPDGYDDQAHMARSHLAKWTERYTMKDKDNMEVVFIVDDPVFLKNTFTWTGVQRRVTAQALTNAWECDPESDAREIYSTFKNPYPDDNTLERFFNIK